MKVGKGVVVIPIVVAAIITVFIVSLGIGETLLSKQVQNEVKRLFASSKDSISTKIFTYDQVNNLPEPVQRYFKYALRDGQHYVSCVRLKHAGTFREGEEQGWMPIVGEEYFTADRPGFVWSAKISVFPLLFWISGIDLYIGGHGNLQIKLLSLFTIADAKGKETDEAELMRWLAERTWFPTALLPSKYVRWEPLDSSSAKATVKQDNGLTATTVFYFNSKGEITQLTADRFRAVGNSYSKDKWVGYFRDYARVDNMMIPQELEAAWHLSSGQFSYAKFRITNIEYDKPSKY